MSNMEGLELTLSTILNQQQKVDNKANVFIALEFAIVSIILSNHNLYLSYHESVLIFFVSIPFVISLWSFYSVHLPILKTSKGETQNKNALFFKSIAESEEQEFYDYLHSKDFKWEEDLQQQIFANSLITNSKYNYLNRGLTNLRVYIIMEVALIIITFLT